MISLIFVCSICEKEFTTMEKMHMCIEEHEKIKGE